MQSEDDSDCPSGNRHVGAIRTDLLSIYMLYAQGGRETGSVTVIRHNVLRSVAPTGHMVDGAGKFKSQGRAMGREFIEDNA